MGIEYDWQGSPDDPRAPAYDDRAEVAVDRAIARGDILDLDASAAWDAVGRIADADTIRALLAPVWSTPAFKALRDKMTHDEDLRDAAYDALRAEAEGE